MQRTYLAIDLKSYYASAECAARHLDPLTTNLVVADSSRTEKTICLAVSPSLKAYGIPGRARLFEVVQKVKEVNANRLREAVRLRKAVYKDGRPFFSSASYDSLSIAADPSLELSYLVAPPRMAYYEKVSRQIYGIYLKYIAPEDIVVYSIDEVFIDATSYLSHYNMTAHDLAMTMIREVLYTTGITATAGIGTNLYLAKLAMDITAKHAAPDKDGVRISATTELFERIADKTLTVRRITIAANRVVKDEGFFQVDLFTDTTKLEKEKKLQNAMLGLKKKFGKNAVLKGTNYLDGATMRERNQQIGGHKAK